MDVINNFMNLTSSEGISRRKFLKASARGMAKLTALGIVSAVPLTRKAVAAGEIRPPDIRIEPNPVVKVLRWSEFVRSEKQIWLENTRRWEKLTGGRVETDFLSWTQIRPKAALEATIGTGHDIVFGWHDDPHLYPDRLIDLTDLAQYLGKKYGGWYPICEIYGRAMRTARWIALPIRVGGTCINYRQSRVQEAGFEALPGNIEGLIRCCKALRSKGHYTGFALGHAVGDANTWTHWWLWSFGGKAVEADGKTVAINSMETVQALNAARELFETMIPGVEQWLDPDNNKAFLNGEISVTNNASSIVYKAKHNFEQIYADLAVANMPVGPLGRPAELQAVSMGFIFKHSPVPNAARHYLAFMFEAEQYGDWVSGSQGYITQALRQFYDLPAWRQDARITPFRECASRLFPNSYAGPPCTASAAAMSEFIIVDMFADACTEKKSPRQAALTAEKRLARLYRQA
ncbi:MAG: ABC transporter substrate-binding protein [Desulfobacteraceae bacterium]|jgi:multiple sugar transport system substrate-binding protein